MCELTTEIKKYLKIMELPEDTELMEIEKTFHHLKALYSTNSSIITAVSENSEDMNRDEIIEELEHAYRELVKFFENRNREKTESHKIRVEKNQIPEFECYNGEALKITREVMGITLHEIAFSSKIPVKLLEYIEEEALEKLPPSAYVRAYVKTYAKYLSLDENKVVTDYFKKSGQEIKIEF